jgi:hypothetical protein
MRAPGELLAPKKPAHLYAYQAVQPPPARQALRYSVKKSAAARNLAGDGSYVL